MIANHIEAVPNAVNHHNSNVNIRRISKQGLDHFVRVIVSLEFMTGVRSAYFQLFLQGASNETCSFIICKVCRT